MKSVLSRHWIPIWSSHEHVSRIFSYVIALCQIEALIIWPDRDTLLKGALSHFRILLSILLIILNNFQVIQVLAAK